MPDGYLWVTEAQQQQLKELLRTDQPRVRRDVGDADYMAPEVYTVLVPVGGIPGIDSYGDASYAECTAYARRGTQLQATQLQLPVYNLSTADVPAGYARAVRDKFGTWSILGAVSKTIEFTVVTDCSFNTFTCVFTKTTSTIRITGDNLSVEVV